MEVIIETIENQMKRMGIEISSSTNEMKFNEDLGMDSLLMAELAAKLQKKFGVSLKKQIMNFQTVNDLANYIDDGMKSQNN